MRKHILYVTVTGSGSSTIFLSAARRKGRNCFSENRSWRLKFATKGLSQCGFHDRLHMQVKQAFAFCGGVALLLSVSNNTATSTTPVAFANVINCWIDSINHR